MRPIRLMTRAFGPYAGLQVLDFRELDNRALFLIHGPTGAGKTSILDAICFALYGECSGADREYRRMRSDHADSSVVTEVVFDFRLGGDAYRVFRRPEQLRPKKRGGGTTLARAEATLWRRNGLTDDNRDGTVLANQWTGVTEEIERLLGFRSDQFRQVVILPQGEFRRLLLADSRERQDILEVLFRTELYRRIEEALKRAAKEIETQVKEVRRSLSFILEQAGAESEDVLRGQHLEVQTRIEKVEARLVDLTQADKTAQERLSQGRQIAERLREVKEAEALLTQIETEVSLFQQKRGVLGWARKAAVLQADERILEQRNREADEAGKKLRTAREAVAAARVVRDGAQQRFEDAKAQLKQLESAREELSRLENLTGRVAELDQASKRLFAAERNARKGSKERSAAQEALEKVVQQCDDKRDTLEKVRQVAARRELVAMRLAEAKARHEQLGRLRDLGRSEDSLLKSLQDLETEVAGAEASLAKSSSHYKELETAWIDGQASVLAALLAPGTPCPVCGSTEHPAPAATAGNVPTETSLKRAARAVEDMRTEKDRVVQRKMECQQRMLAIQAEARVLREGLGDVANREISGLAKEVDSLRKELADVEAHEQRVVELTRDVAALEASLVQARASLKEVEAKAAESAAEQQRAEATLLAIQGDVPEEFSKPSLLTRAKDQLRQTMAGLEAAFLKAQKELDLAAQSLVAKEASFEAAEENAAVTAQRSLDQKHEFAANLSAAGFPDEKVFRDAKKTASEIAELEAEITAFDRRRESARDRLARAAQAATGLSHPDMASLEQAAVRSREELSGALREEARLRESLKRINSWLADYEKHSGELAALEEQYAVVGRLAEVSSGNNKDGITFQRFVLAALLDDVLATASKRLHLMSNGRFHLQRVRDRADRRTAGGLDLEVHDAYTGTTRPASTLSGGESFLASLSLALGLADVVQLYAGGMHLETIFVDEGFGSLDEEALDQALRALVDLQQTGRLVGIISHVRDLRERIDTRLEVTADRHGSRARFVVG